MKFFLFFSLIMTTSFLITLVMYLVRKYYVKSEKKFSENIHPALFSFYTSLYAFFLGFAIVTLWSAYLHAEANVNREANALIVAYRISYNGCSRKR